ncbi:MAG: hypothetical protein JWO31_4293 [Phycisphaerales bacterium]|nr:hypothetical protein [Phycisphaerales bacterium]
MYDRPGSPLPGLARSARAGGFAGGASWMAAALGDVRAGLAPAGGSAATFHRLGFTKYSAASAAAAVAGAAAIWAGLPWPVATAGAVVAFYAAEVQMLFLFPAPLDGSRRPFRDARRWLVRAGGTRLAVPVVMRLAAHMLFGGLGGRGVLRAWCLGCLAVCVWYEDVRRRDEDGGERDGEAPLQSPIPSPAHPPTRPHRPRFAVGGAGDLLLRVERVRARRPRVDHGLPSDPSPRTILYASDLHLGWPWTRRVAGELLAAARATAADAVVLGGDLVDRGAALPALGRLVRDLAAVGPVYALPGNHDVRPGVGRVRAVVRSEGGVWLPDGDVCRPDGLCLTARRSEATAGFNEPPPAANPLDPPNGCFRVLCAHNPVVIRSAAAVGVDVVLAGHLHGGQCVLTERGGLLYPGAWANRWTGLRFEPAGPDAVGPMLLVSRGAGDTLPLRWNCPREVILCRIDG